MKTPALITLSLVLAATLLAAAWSSPHFARAADTPTTQPISSSDSAATRHELIKEKERVTTEVVGLQTRLDQTQKQLTDLNTTIEKEIAADPAITAYKQALVQRMKRLSYLQTSPSFTPDDIGNTLQTIADLQFRITERTDRIHTFSHDYAFQELAILRIHADTDLKDAQSRLQSITTRLNDLH